MKSFRYLYAGALLSLLVACAETEPWDPKPRNVGVEELEVNTDSLEFLPRGGTLRFTVAASYDGTITADDWMVLQAGVFPGDGTAFTVTVSADANKTGADRSGTIIIATPGLQHEIHVSQADYARPESPETITTAEELAYWLETCAIYCEPDEVMTLSRDIDLNGWTLVPCERFSAVLDGQGHALRNWKSAGLPLFWKNEGTIANLVIDASCAFDVPGDGRKFGPFAAENYGVVSGCTNQARITMTETPEGKTYIGGIVGYHYPGARLADCTNRGEIRFEPATVSANVLIGGMTCYASADIIDCHNYGPIHIHPADTKTSAQYFIAGISPRHETGLISGCTNHKEGEITISGGGSMTKSYVGGIIGYHADRSPSSDCAHFGNIYMDYAGNGNYLGGLLGYQARVTDQPFTLFENSIVNFTLTAREKANAQNGDNPLISGGLVMGRFAGQADRQVCHFGSDERPIKVAGTIACLSTGNRVAATAKGFGPLVDGDGSGSNLNNAGSTWQVFHAVYEVVGDGVDQDPESLIIRTDPLTLYVSHEGGTVTFSVRSNYEASLSSRAGWVTLSETTVPGDGADHLVHVAVDANEESDGREAVIAVSLPLGTQENVIISQSGNPLTPESLEVDQTDLAADPSGALLASLTITANDETRLSCTEDWLTLSQAEVPGDGEPHRIYVSAARNLGGASRSGEIAITLPRGLSKVVTVRQEAFSETSLDGKTVLFIGNSFIYYGGCVEEGGQRETDGGLFYKLCRACGEEVRVIDCTYGAHHLYDFTAEGCTLYKSGKTCHPAGYDLLQGIDLSRVDVVVFSESGDNNAAFLTDLAALKARFTNPGTRFYHLTHSYFWYKNFRNILDAADQMRAQGIADIPWGKLVYDIAGGTVAVPSARMAYDKNTFINNRAKTESASADTYHPNPLSGYVTAVMTYCALTGKAADGLPLDILDGTVYGGQVTGLDAYREKYYTDGATSNFKEVLLSEPDMRGIRSLCTQYTR